MGRGKEVLCTDGPDTPGREFNQSASSVCAQNLEFGGYFVCRGSLAQIAVSTVLRTSSIGYRKVRHAEHCRYGTRDLALIEPRRPVVRSAKITYFGITILRKIPGLFAPMPEGVP
jgi:hypothetical protein